MDTTAANITHVAFADETHYNVGRYRAIASISLPFICLEEFQANIAQILSDSSVHEFKWKKLTSARMRFAAIKLLDWTIKQANRSSLRVDVLIWDITDQRHDVKGRDDLKNMQFMYYKLFRNVLSERWPDDTVWGLFPDEQMAIKWHQIRNVLKKRTMKRVELEDPLLREEVGSYLRQLFHLELFEPRPSHLEPFIQLADFFAGLGVYSWDSFGKYHYWCEQNSNQKSLLPDTDGFTLSSSDRERCIVLHELDCLCKNNKLQVALKSSNGLNTRNPQKPINFWFYRPTYEYDTAPIKY